MNVEVKSTYEVRRIPKGETRTIRYVFPTALEAFKVARTFVESNMCQSVSVFQVTETRWIREKSDH